jgi:radical SAM superfamily enzyme YgiQ (UPF0313 family)
MMRCGSCWRLIAVVMISWRPSCRRAGAAFALNSMGAAAILRELWLGPLAESNSSEQHRKEVASMSGLRAYNVLMVYPRFQPNTFWNYSETCRIAGARYPSAPLGLITVAAMLPPHWKVRLVNRNTQDVAGKDFVWADMVMTGGMIVQQFDTQRIIKLAHLHGKPVVVGGPDATSSPHLYQEADFRVLGEVEDILSQFIAAWESGVRSGDFIAEKFQVNVTKTPLPRFDLLRTDHYMFIGVQFSRGCPFTCEFCDIIELYGRVPRTKTPQQMLAELQALYNLGYRGHVDFVDDNLIGNRKSLRIFLPELIAWQQKHDYPFEFSTEASINLADDHELLHLMRKANFFAIFVGIESPDPATLVHTRKKQNTRRNIAESIHKLYGAGILATAGFIVGFDTEKDSIADAMADLIEDAAIPVAMVGLLYALPNTQLARRLEKEGRLHANNGQWSHESGDQCTFGLNYDSVRPERDILSDYRRILKRIYDPLAFARRLDRLSAMLDRSGRPADPSVGDERRDLALFEFVRGMLSGVPEAREAFLKVCKNCLSTNPRALRQIVSLMMLYTDLGPFSRFVIKEIDRRIEAIDRAAAPAGTGSLVASTARLP